MRRNNKRLLSALLCAALLLGCTACGKTAEPADTPQTTEETVQPVYTDVPDSLRKAETVYVNLDNAGAVRTVTVTDWLHTDKGAVATEDKSDLADVRDIKGSVVPQKQGDSLVWQMATTDLYYQGVSEKTPPVSFTLKYRLDGKELSAERIAGKKGRAEIEVTMENNCEENGVYLPVVAAGVMILPEGTFSAVEVENGLSVGDGAKQIVVGAGVPGMAKSLGLTQEGKIGSIQLADHFTVTADTDCFELDNLYFIVLPICSMDAGSLIPGSEQEAAQFLRQTENILRALQNVDVRRLLDALSGDRISEIVDMVNEAADLYGKNEALLKVLTKYMTPENLENIGALLTALQDPETTEMLSKLNNPLARNLLSGLPELLEAVEKLTPTLNAMQKDLQDPKVKAALDALPETLTTLSALKEQLDQNSELLELVSGVLNDDLLTALSAAADSDETQTALSALADDSKQLLPRLQAYLKFGKSYGLFTDAPENAKISLLFVYMTPSLRQAKQETVEPATAPQPWYKTIFK